jgi:hypothetical protein
MLLRFWIIWGKRNIFLPRFSDWVPSNRYGPNDVDKTAFSTKEGHWAYRRTPFGLKTAPATIQKMMNNVLSGLTGTRCFVFYMTLFFTPVHWLTVTGN